MFSNEQAKYEQMSWEMYENIPLQQQQNPQHCTPLSDEVLKAVHGAKNENSILLQSVEGTSTRLGKRKARRKPIDGVEQETGMTKPACKNSEKGVRRTQKCYVLL